MQLMWAGQGSSSLPSASSLGPSVVHQFKYTGRRRLDLLTAYGNSWLSILSELELAFSMMSCYLEKSVLIGPGVFIHLRNADIFQYL